VLIDESRKRDAGLRRGIAVELKDHHAVSSSNPDQIALLCLALRKLGKQDSRAGAIAELHYLAGRESAEIARMLSLNERTIQRNIKLARAWLKRELTGSTDVAGAVGQS
jgi:RNA polymerase sigma-70 factor, ECF subfamily